MLLSPLAALAADDLQRLISATSLTCEFTTGHVTRWLQDEPAADTDRFRDVIRLRDINHDNGYARLQGATSSTEVVMLASILGVTFLEGTEAGNLNVITVYPYDVAHHAGDEQPSFAAVMSRHVMIDGKPLPSQHAGTCRVGSDG